jgi:DNA invertase Pin-like site-specific DNA recombinase
MRRVLGYLGLEPGEVEEAQTIRAACERPDLQLVELVREEATSSTAVERPRLAHVLRRVAAGDVDGLVVARLDRVSRSVVDFGLLLQWFRDADAALIVVDLGIDTSTPGGRQVAKVFASVADWERETTATRTREALAAARARGEPSGRAAVSDRPELAERIRQMHADEDLGLQAIADRLNDEGVPTARGAAIWRPSSVQSAAGYKRPGSPSHAVPQALQEQPASPPRRTLAEIAEQENNHRCAAELARVGRLADERRPRDKPEVRAELVQADVRAAVAALAHAEGPAATYDALLELAAEAIACASRLRADISPAPSPPARSPG